MPPPISFYGRPPVEAGATQNHEAIPKPFVLAPHAPLPQVLDAGQPLTFSLVLGGQAIWHFPYLLAAFRALGWRGLGGQWVRAGLSEAAAWLPDTHISLMGEAADSWVPVGPSQCGGVGRGEGA